MRISFSIALMVLLLISASLEAAEKMRIAVIDLKGKGVSSLLTNAVSNLIRSEMVKTGLYTVIERSQMKQVLQEQELQMTGCTDDACAVQVGKLLSARKILVGEISRLGKFYMITVRIVDVEKGVSEYSASEKAESEEVLDRSVNTLTRSLSKSILKGHKYDIDLEDEPVKTENGYYLRGLVPGWGQFYADQSLKGTAFLGSFILASALTFYTYSAYKKADSDYHGLPEGTPQSEFNSKYDAYDQAANKFLYAASITAIIYIANWVDMLFFTEFKPGKSSAGNEKGNSYRLFVNNRFYNSGECVFLSGMSMEF